MEFQDRKKIAPADDRSEEADNYIATTQNNSICNDKSEIPLSGFVSPNYTHRGDEHGRNIHLQNRSSSKFRPKTSGNQFPVQQNNNKNLSTTGTSVNFQSSHRNIHTSGIVKRMQNSNSKSRQQLPIVEMSSPRKIEKDKFKSTISAMNIVEIMRDQPNIKVKRNKKVNYRSNGGSDGRGLLLPSNYKGILSTSMLRDKKAMQGLIFRKDQEENVGKNSSHAHIRGDHSFVMSVLPPKSSRQPRTYNSSPFDKGLYHIEKEPQQDSMYRNRSRQKHLEPIIVSEMSAQTLIEEQNIESLKNKLKDINRSKNLNITSYRQEKKFTETNSLEGLRTPISSDEKSEERMFFPSKSTRNLSKKLKESLRIKTGVYGAPLSHRPPVQQVALLENNTFQQEPPSSYFDQDGSQIFEYAKLKKRDLIQLLYLANQKIGLLSKNLNSVDKSPTRENSEIKKLHEVIKQKDIQLKQYYDKLNNQHEQHQSEIKILKNHNKELQENLIKQVIINKQHQKFTVSLSQSFKSEKIQQNLDSMPSISSSKN